LLESLRWRRAPELPMRWDPERRHAGRSAPARRPERDGIAHGPDEPPRGLDENSHSVAVLPLGHHGSHRRWLV